MVVVVLAGIVFWLWKRPGGHSITDAAVDLVTALNCEVDQLKKQVKELEIKAADAGNRITILQGELALANQEVSALEQLVNEQSGRIADLRTENNTLRRQVARIAKKTGGLEE